MSQSLMGKGLASDFLVLSNFKNYQYPTHSPYRHPEKREARYSHPGKCKQHHRHPEKCAAFIRNLKANQIKLNRQFIRSRHKAGTTDGAQGRDDGWGTRP